MTLNKPIYFLIITLFLHYIDSRAQQLRPQHPAANRAPDAKKIIVNPRNVRAMDSLRMLDDIHRWIDNNPGESQLTKINRSPQKINSAPVRGMRPKKTSGDTSVSKKSLAELRPNAVCYTISGRDFLMQASLMLWTGDPTLTSDGNVLVSGQFGDYSISPYQNGGFCMKTDIEGNMIWGKLFDSTANVQYDYLNCFKSVELQNGSILLAGRTTNKVSGNDDFVLMKLDNNGNQIWQKTYESKFWQGFNGSGDLFGLRDIKEDPATGEIYFTGYHWFGPSVITKIDLSDGRILWSNAYDSGNSEFPFGTIINPGQLLLFQLENGYYNQSYVTVIAINKTNGDTLYTKRISQTGDLYSPRLYGTYSMVQLKNGNYRMCGPTTGYWEYPAYTGTKDLHHAGIIELDNNLNFVKAFGFKNRVESNSYNTKISLYPDGTGVFTMFDYASGYNGDSHISIFKDDLIYHQRKRIHINEGMPYEPAMLQLPDGGHLNIKLMGDSTKMASDGARIDYYRMYSSDTASLCLGVKDTVTSIWYFNFEPAYRGLDSIHRNVFRESRLKKYDTWSFNTTQEPSCVVISHCDTFDLKTNATTICPGKSVTVTVSKNKECGSLVPLVYDTTFVDRVIKLTDSTYVFYFEKPGSGYIHGSLMGCVLRTDSVFVEVLPTRYSLDLGADTVLCPGNQIKLNAGSGFASYLWQDGSADSTYMVTRPGIYHVLAVNGCGSIYRDTVIVKDHPPIDINVGPDRFKCNSDTLHLQATPGFINYRWTPDYNINSTSGQIVIVNPLTDTVYTLVAEKKPGCFAYDTVRVQVSISPGINLGSDTSICRYDILTLDAGAGFSSYLWNTGSNQRSLTIGQPGVYFVKAITEKGCSSFDTLRLLKLHDLPQPNLGSDSVICAGQPRILSSGDQYLSYHWNTGSTNSSITASQPGKYWLTVIDGNGCKGADTTFIPSIEQPPGLFLGLDTAICSYGNLTLKSSSHFDRQLWNTGSAAATITINQPGIYWLEVIDDNNCKGTDTIIVAQKDCMEGLFVPDAFTPNGDGLNDVFRPMLFGDIKSFMFRIYNRWGQVVFETTTPGKGWDGNYIEQNQDSNVFVWSCTYQLNGKQPEQKSGKVVLIR